MFDVIKAQLSQAVPYAALTGIEVLEVADGSARCALGLRTEVSNHIGTLHAGALFTLGETASGAAMTGAFAAELMNVRPIATGATIRYLKAGKGWVEAEAVLARPAQELRAELDQVGRVSFDANVTVRNAANEEVATLVVGWLVSRR